MSSSPYTYSTVPTSSSSKSSQRTSSSSSSSSSTSSKGGWQAIDLLRPMLERCWQQWICEFIGVILITVLIQQRHIDMSLSEPILNAFVLSVVAGLAVGIMHYNFPENHFNPWLLINDFLYELLSARMGPSQCILHLVNLFVLLALGIGGASVGTLISYQRTNSWDNIGLPHPSPTATNHDIMFAEFIGAFLFTTVWHWQRARNEHTRQEKTSDHHVVGMMHGSAMGVGFALAVSYTYAVSGGNINIYYALGSAWFANSYHGITQYIYGQMLGTAGATVILMLGTIMKRKFTGIGGE